jgi:hypothetical protein
MHLIWKTTKLITPKGVKELDARKVSSWLRETGQKVKYDYDIEGWQVTNGDDDVKWNGLEYE